VRGSGWMRGRKSGYTQHDCHMSPVARTNECNSDPEMKISIIYWYKSVDAKMDYDADRSWRSASAGGPSSVW